MRQLQSFLPLFLVFLSHFGYAAQAKEVVFDSLDGTTLKAWVFHPAELPNSNTVKPKSGTVVAFHGCGGLYATTGARKGQFNARHQAMADLLVEQGYNAVFPDSLTSRGETSICVQAIGRRSVTQKERRADALATLAWVAQQPWADAGRIGALGWSHGGSAVLAVTDTNHKDVKNQQLKNKLSFKTAVAFYPGCAESRKNDYRPNAPLTLFLGADDDWTPPIPCIELAKQLQAETYPNKYAVELNVYEGAVHDFDNPIGGVTERKNIPSRLYPGQGVKAGANPVAREKAYARLKEILKAAID
jgi:dienelactone hydrolase